MPDGKKETLSITTFKKWPFANEFRIETKDGRFLSVFCKYCSKVECNDFMREARSRNIKGCALKLICFFQESVIYICGSTFACHEGT